MFDAVSQRRRQRWSLHWHDDGWRCWATSWPHFQPTDRRHSGVWCVYNFYLIIKRGRWENITPLYWTKKYGGKKKNIFWETSIFNRPQGSIQMFGHLSRVYTHQAVKSTCPQKVGEWQRQEKVTCLVFWVVLTVKHSQGRVAETGWAERVERTPETRRASSCFDVDLKTEI